MRLSCVGDDTGGHTALATRRNDFWKSVQARPIITKYHDVLLRGRCEALYAASRSAGGAALAARRIHSTLAIR
jgi:hypothetical protein